MKLLTVLALPMLLGACPGALPASVVVGGITLGAETIVCAAQTIAQDTASTPTTFIGWWQVALDLAKNCGLDVAEIVALFGEAHPVSLAARANAATIHAAATAKRSGVSTHAPATGAGSAGQPAK